MNPNPAQFGGSFQQTPQQQQKGCLGRNWKWMLPVGCLGLILAGVLFVGGIVFVAMSAIKSSEVYKGALGVAQAHPAVNERLGQPVEDGWFVKGSIKLNATGGSADLEIPLSGPKGAGTLFVRAVSPEGTWMYQRLDLVTGGKTVSLLDRNLVQPSPGSTVDVEEDADGSDGDATGEATDGNENTQAGGAAGGQTISGGVLNGKAISKPQPPYPALAKAARAQGTVVVQVTVDETGGVTSAKAVSGHPLLQQAAIAAAKQAKFSPTLLSGKPVKVSGMLTYNFVLEQ
ncbi:MAG TPA: cytochrome c oxidase assembly factor Coa1 family protein [Pyrinomonadaceae bacterium]|nr:cytochrome c oxidase assembly factor Coa1 family protein [Pyrinomonadaceae bacterium]